MKLSKYVFIENDGKIQPFLGDFLQYENEFERFSFSIKVFSKTLAK